MSDRKVPLIIQCGAFEIKRDCKHGEKRQSVLRWAISQLHDACLNSKKVKDALGQASLSSPSPPQKTITKKETFQLDLPNFQCYRFQVYGSKPEHRSFFLLLNLHQTFISQAQQIHKYLLIPTGNSNYSALEFHSLNGPLPNNVPIETLSIRDHNIQYSQNGCERYEFITAASNDVEGNSRRDLLLLSPTLTTKEVMKIYKMLPKSGLRKMTVQTLDETMHLKRPVPITKTDTLRSVCPSHIFIIAGHQAKERAFVFTFCDETHVYRIPEGRSRTVLRDLFLL
jgi:hypothetical protein